MQINCPNCATSYQVKAASLGATGRSVRCVHCKTVWFAKADEQPPIEIAEAPDAAAGEPVTAAIEAAAPEPPAPAPGGAESLPPIDEISFPTGADMLPEPVSAQPPPQDLDALPPLAAFAQGPDVGAHDAMAFPAQREKDQSPVSRAKIKAMSVAARVRQPSMSTLILSLMAVIAAIFGFRADVVRLMPQTASLFAAVGLPVNLRGLAFDSVKMTKEVHEGVPVLVLEGRISNVSKLMLEVPRIRFAMRSGAGTEVYSWTTLPQRSILAPGDGMPFHTRLASPPAEGKEVAIRFFNRRDTLAGIR